MTTDFAVAARQEQNIAQVRQNNVQTFLRMWLSLGADCIKAVGNSHADEINEALGLAASRWEQLLNLEAQIPREEANLAVLERGRVADAADEFAGPELRAKKDLDHRNRGRVAACRAEAVEGRSQAHAPRTRIVHNESEVREMAGKTPVDMPANLPASKKPNINRPQPQTIPVPKPPYTPTPPAPKK